MHVQTETSIVYVLKLTEQDLADALVDPSALQDTLRQARAAHVSSKNQDHPNPYRASGVSAKAIQRAAKKQAKQSKRFLAPAGAFACADCDKTFDHQKSLNLHRGKMHKATNGHQPTPAAIRPGNTSPLSVQDAD